MFQLQNIIIKTSIRPFIISQIKHCHSVFGINKLAEQEKPVQYKVSQVALEKQNDIIKIIKQYFLSENTFVKSRKMLLSDDFAIDEYLMRLLKQGNTLCAITEDNAVAGVCVNHAVSPVDPKNLRNFAFYRQNQDTKDFLFFMAKLDETPNLWSVYDQMQIFEIKMLTVLPGFRRQGLASLLLQKSKELAKDLGYSVIRMNCINPYDYKVAENCNMNCIVKFPLHKLRSNTAPYIKKSSEFNRIVRVYIEVLDNIKGGKIITLNDSMKMCKMNLDDCLE